MFQTLLTALAIMQCYISMESIAYDFSQEYFGVHFTPYPSKTDVEVAGAYNADGVLALVRQIGTKFRKILVPNEDSIYDDDNSLHLIPSAVAKLNLERKSAGKPPLELTILTNLNEEILDVDVLQRFDFSIDLADRANAIYPGTVKLLQILPPGNMKDDTEIAVYCRQKLNRSNTNQYQLGVLLHIYACDSLFENTKEQLESFLSLVNHLAFVVGPADHNLNHGSVTFFKRIKPLMKECKNKVVSQGSPDLDVSFSSEWSDTDDIGQQNTKYLVTFWRLMNDFAVTTNTTVMMREAFDQPFRELTKAHLGWWRLVEDSSYFSATDYVFQEKGDFEVPPPKSTKYERSVVKQPLNFSEEYFVVKLNPYPSSHDVGVPDAYDESGVMALAKVVATRFRKLEQGSVITDVVFKPENSLHLLPTAIAKLNVERAKAGQPHPITIALTCDLQEDDVTPEVLKRFELTLQLANMANAIFPGTVDTLFQMSDREEDLDKEIEILEYSRSLLNASGNVYKLGLKHRFSACDTLVATDSAKLEKMLRLADTITLRAPPLHSIIKYGSKSFLRSLKRLALSCKTKLMTVAPHLELIIESYWPDTDDDGNQDFGQFIHFWQAMNNFAVKNKIMVVLDEAFDVPYYGTTLENRMGWWRLVDPPDVTDPSQYIFEEKINLVTQKDKVSPDVSGESHEDSNRTVLGGERFSIGTAIPAIICFAMMVALVTVVFLHMRKQMRQIENRLSDEEVHAFFHGNSMECCLSQGESSDGETSADGKAYDKGLEVEMDSVIIDKRSLLGSGEFGEVFRGLILKEQETLGVAVKMTKPGCSTTAIRGMLAEIKIMSHIGRHENIVSIIGAHTSQLQNGNKVFIFLELCELGSLESYLQDLHQNLQNRKVEYVNLENGVELTSVPPRMDTEQDQQLLKWCIEIASGMEYLASKHVVHADLATRNVLLTSDKIAKVSDFGLSRRLYEYTNYVKKKQEPLPWRWMAPESLRRLVFNEKTDVWAFGVTMWEICSLGEVPYPGLAWNVDFVQKLVSGLRLRTLTRDTYDLYELMIDCWHPDPNERPCFTELSRRLEHRTVAVLGGHACTGVV